MSTAILNPIGCGFLMISGNGIARSPILEAFESMSAGDFHRVLALLHNVDAPGSTVMRARALYRLLHYDRTVTECNRRASSAYDFHESVQLLELQVAAHAGLGEDGLAFDTLERMRLVAKKSGERVLVATALQLEFWLALFTGDVDRARATLAATRSKLETLTDTRPRKPHHVDPLSIRAGVAHFEGWLHGLLGDSAAVESCFLAAATTFADPRLWDRSMEAQVLSNLASFIVEIRSQATYEYLASRFVTFPWTSHTDARKSMIKAALIHGHRLYGFNCPDGVKARTTPTLSTRFSLVEAGLLYDEWDDRREFIEDCRFCVSMVLEINSSESSGVEIGSILSFAAVLAPFDRALAHRTREIFQQRREKLPRFWSPTHRQAAEARIRFVDACVAKADGDLSRALALYNQVFDIWKPSWDGPLPAIAGLEKYSITRDPSYLAFARDFIIHHPRTRFSRRLAAALQAAETVEPTGFPYLGLYAPNGSSLAGSARTSETKVSALDDEA